VTDTSQDGIELRLAEFTELLATAIENADAREAVQRLVEEQAALRRMATLVAREASQAEVFGAIAEEIGRLIRAQAIRMLRYERDDTAVVVASWGVDGDVFPQVGFRAKLGGDNATSRVFLTGEAVRIDNYEGASGPIGEAVKASSPLRSSVATPIVVEGRIWGVVIAGTSSSDPMPPDTESRLIQFSDLMATAIANAESREALAALADEQAALRRVATLAARESSPEEVLEAVAAEAARVLEVDAIGLLRFEPNDTATLVAQSETPWDPPPLGTRFTLEGENIIASVHRTGQAARMDDWERATGSVAAMANVLGVRSTVASPIVVEGQLWGTMIAATNQSTPLPADTESRIVEFTELLATSIANAESREALSRLAAEQAALRRVATLVAQDVTPSEIFSAVSEEVTGLFRAGSAVLRFDDEGPAVVHAGKAGWSLSIGTRWELEEGMAATAVYRTGRSARVDDRDWSSDTGPWAAVARQVGLVSSVVSPIVVEGRLWGAMSVASAEEILPLDTESRLEKFTELVATAIANAENRSELAASRKRLVAASDEARRRIERDLHDGTQQRLVSLALAARAAAAELPTESGDAREKFSWIATGLGEAVEDLQELSRGIHPAILSDAGLGPALETLALRSPIPVELEVRTRDRFPEPVEVAAYFTASESLANAAKHSQASRITVLLAFENERLRLSVRDDGIGGADPGRGSGLVGLRDRVEALGGTLAIESGSGAGTSLSATLPVGDPGDPTI
jgi:signal transduction histidine kinase